MGGITMTHSKKADSRTEALQKSPVSDNIARYLKEHEQSAANKRNMHIHEPEGPVRDED
jgi:hypothetical protein